MYQKLKNICIAIFNMKNGPFWRKGRCEIKRGGRNIVLNGVKVKSNGVGNYLFIGDGVRLKNVVFNISGNNNQIRIDEGCSLCDTLFSTEENGNTIWLKAGTTTTGGVLCSAIEGTNVIIGEDGMISREVYLASGDGHGIIGTDGKRTNYSEDIIIGKHVWLGYRTVINKGTIIPDNCIVGVGAVVGRKINKDLTDGCVIGGNPAMVKKRNVNWTRNRKDGEF